MEFHTFFVNLRVGTTKGGEECPLTSLMTFEVETSLLPKVGPRAAKKPKFSIGRMASFDDAVADQHRGACALPESHFPDSRTLSWTDGQLGASAATSQSDSPFIVHADFAGIPQKVRHLRSSGLWKKGSRREVARVSGTPL